LNGSSYRTEEVITQSRRLFSFDQQSRFFRRFRRVCLPSGIPRLYFLNLFESVPQTNFPNDLGYFDILALEQVSDRLSISVDSVCVLGHRLVAGVECGHDLRVFTIFNNYSNSLIIVPRGFSHWRQKLRVEVIAAEEDLNARILVVRIENSVEGFLVVRAVCVQVTGLIFPEVSREVHLGQIWPAVCRSHMP